MSFINCKPKTIKSAYLSQKCNTRRDAAVIKDIAEWLIAGFGVRIQDNRKSSVLKNLSKSYGLDKDCLLSIDDGCCYCILHMPHCICQWLGYDFQMKKYTAPYMAGSVIALNFTPAFPECLMVVKNGHMILHHGQHFTVDGDSLTLIHGDNDAKPDCPDTYCVWNMYKSGRDCPTCGFGGQTVTYNANYPKNTVIGINEPNLIPESVRVVWKQRFHLKPGRDFLVTADGGVQILFEGVVEADCPHTFQITYAIEGEPPSRHEQCVFSGFACACKDVEPFDAEYFIRLPHCPLGCSVELYFDCGGSSNGVLVQGEGADYTVDEEEGILYINFESEKAGRFCWRYAY